MNAHLWLATATFGMPQAVKARVAAETLGHLQDAGYSEDADVRMLLGDAEQVGDELRRLYVSEEEYRRLVRNLGAGWASRTLPWMNVLCWPMFALWSLLDPRIPLHGLWSYCTVFVLCSAALLWLTGRLPPSRRELWRGVAFNLVAAVMMWTLPELLTTMFPVILLPILPTLIWARRTVRDDARLRRTLALEGVIG